MDLIDLFIILLKGERFCNLFGNSQTFPAKSQWYPTRIICYAIWNFILLHVPFSILVFLPFSFEIVIYWIFIAFRWMDDSTNYLKTLISIWAFGEDLLLVFMFISCVQWCMVSIGRVQKDKHWAQLAIFCKKNY